MKDTSEPLGDKNIEQMFFRSMRKNVNCVTLTGTAALAAFLTTVSFPAQAARHHHHSDSSSQTRTHSSDTSSDSQSHHHHRRHSESDTDDQASSDTPSHHHHRHHSDSDSDQQASSDTTTHHHHRHHSDSESDSDQQTSTDTTTHHHHRHHSDSESDSDQQASSDTTTHHHHRRHSDSESDSDQQASSDTTTHHHHRHHSDSESDSDQQASSDSSSHHHHRHHSDSNDNVVASQPTTYLSPSARKAAEAKLVRDPHWLAHVARYEAHMVNVNREHELRLAEVQAHEDNVREAYTALHSGNVVRAAEAFRGTPYVMGGTSRSGFDCSGFTRYILGESAGVELPRTAEEQYYTGQPIDKSDLRAGDLVFFRDTYRHGISHVGMYVGDGRFVHACSPSKGVTVSSLSEQYYINHWAGARRVLSTRSSSDE